MQALHAQNGGTVKQEVCVSLHLLPHQTQTEPGKLLHPQFLSVLSGNQAYYLGKPEFNIFHKQIKLLKCILPVPRDNYFC